MQIAQRWQKTRAMVAEYPRQFWVLMFAAFIDRLGGSLVFPFFALYLTQKFDVGLTEIGGLFAIFAVMGIFGSVLGGALADRLGRKGVIIFALITSASASLALGFATSFAMIYVIVIFVGLLADIGGPAVMAMVADLLPEEQHAEGYGVFRVIINMAVVIGPIIGGLLASQSYLLLFILDAISSTITAGVVLVALRETRPAPSADESASPETFVQTLRGYALVFRDTIFVSFVVIGMLVQVVYMQMYNTLPVFLRDERGIPPEGYGYILSLNAALVVLFQFWISRKTRGRAPATALMVACLFYAVGFAMYGVFAAFAFFALAMIFITIGEMIYFPVAQALVAQLSPGHMRGRYMAVFGLGFALPAATNVLLAGMIADSLGPNWIWYLSGLTVLVAAAAYVVLGRVMRDAGRAAETVADALDAANEPEAEPVLEPVAT